MAKKSLFPNMGTDTGKTVAAFVAAVILSVAGGLCFGHAYGEAIADGIAFGVFILLVFTFAVHASGITGSERFLRIVAIGIIYVLLLWVCDKLQLR